MHPERVLVQIIVRTMRKTSQPRSVLLTRALSGRVTISALPWVPLAKPRVTHGY